jgi:hypothetical protein
LINYQGITRNAGYVKTDQIELFVKSREEILSLDISTLVENSHIWVTFDNASWTVLRLNLNTALTIEDIVKDSSTSVVTVTVSQKHGLTVDEIVGIQKTLKVDYTLYFDERNDPQNWMARKTVVKQLAKLLEKDFYGMNALEIDSRMEGGKIIVADDSNNLQIKDAEITPKKNQNIYDVMEIATIEPEPIQEPEKVEENVEDKVESESSLFPKK